MEAIKAIITSFLFAGIGFWLCAETEQSRQSYSGILVVKCDRVLLLTDDGAFMRLHGLSNQEHGYSEVSHMRPVGVRGELNTRGFNASLDEVSIEWFPLDSRSLTTLEDTRREYRARCYSQPSLTSKASASPLPLLR